VKNILPRIIYFFNFAIRPEDINYRGIFASYSIFSGIIVMTLFFKFFVLFNVLSFNMSEYSIDKFEGLGYFKSKPIRELFKSL
jgi:hypothetical protein